MPAPSMQGSRLPRMLPTSSWGIDVAANEKNQRGGNSAMTSSASSTSGSRILGGGGGASSNLSDSVGHGHHGHHHSSSHHHQQQQQLQQSRREKVNAANAQNSKMLVLEQYIQKFPLASPSHAPPILSILEGGNDSAVRQRSNTNPPAVKFADSPPNNVNDVTGVVGGENQNDIDQNNNNNEPGMEETAQKRAEREISSKRQAREAAKQSYELLRRQKVDSWIQMAERNLRKVRRENETLTAIARLTQANALVNDERYEKALESLRAEAELADELRQAGFGPMMAEFAERIDQIQRNMDKIVVEMNKRTVQELAALRAQFEKELEKFNRELEDERNSGLSTKLDWIQKNRDLHRAVTEGLFVSDDLARNHVVLETLHRRRRLDASMVVEEVQLLEESVEKTRRQNSSLRDKLGTLECELSLAQAKENRTKTAAREQAQDQRLAERLQQQQQQQGAERPTSALSSASSRTNNNNNNNSRPGSSSYYRNPNGGNRPPTAASNHTNNTTSSGSTDEAVVAEAQGLFDRISQTISIESKNLQTARHAHVEALKQRTELEVYLKHAILAYQSQLENLHYSVRAGVKADSGGTGLGSLLGNNNSNNKMNNKSYMKSTTAAATKSAMFRTEEDGVQKVKKVEPTVFTVEDRQAVVDSLLSLPRVLTLMFDPVAAANRIRRKQEQQRESRKSGRDHQRELLLSGKLESSRKNHSQGNDDDDDEENDQKLQQNRRVSPDQKLYDDLAKLGVDVVKNRPGFLFHNHHQHQKQQQQRQQKDPSEGNEDDGDDDVFNAYDDEDDEEYDDGQEGSNVPHKFTSSSSSRPNPNHVLGEESNPPLDEDQLWDRWNQWSENAETQILHHQQKQQQQKRK